MRDGREVLMTGDASLGWALACSRTGSSHIRSGKPCQDANDLCSGSIADQAYLIAAVADGHGDDRHDQSQFGAGLAVRAAIEELRSLQTHFGGGDLSSKLVNNFKTHFSRRLGIRWREAVLADAKSRLLEGVESGHNSAAIFPRYGTTLLAALVVEKVLLMGQIGDGEAMVVTKKGIVNFPLAYESENVGGVTDSLCSEESHLRWRTSVLDCSEECVILLSTDGLVNAFADQNQLYTFAQSLYERIREHGLDQVAAALPGWLDHYSNCGSGDDITLAIVVVNPEKQEQSRSSFYSSTADSSDESQGGAYVIGDRTADFRGDSPDLPVGEEKTG